MYQDRCANVSAFSLDPPTLPSLKTFSSQPHVFCPCNYGRPSNPSKVNRVRDGRYSIHRLCVGFICNALVVTVSYMIKAYNVQ